MYKKNSIHTNVAFSAIKEFLITNSTQRIENKKVPNELSYKAACFVTLKTDIDKLRGCIGTLKPVYKNLYTEIIKNAVASAFRDNRFYPLTSEELNSIIITVEVLFPPEKIEDISMLNPKIYGAIVSDKFGRRGVLLPGIEGIDTVENQIQIIKHKANIIQKTNTNLTFYRFKTEKFH
ncbi:MAG: AmmeMemoRadiSam system protein A [Bacteroidales bacterium]|nr:AmmeMemoRadiSam system protein A [Bacteroidales bacterium]